ncbi:MAG TPA: SpaA isopeptide-forming pilin-related protein [Nocardioidaceae bacterium]|nr:SpaA isopeptide-forming pilin-related protein [Nocardioidaceae bacterium]
MASKTKRHHLLRLVVVIAVAMLSLPFMAGSAQAEIIGGFEVDGNQVATTDIDWSNVGGVSKVTDPVGNADTSTFEGGDSEGDNDQAGESGWGIGNPGTPSGKSDIGNILVADYKLNGDTWAAFAWDRAGDTGTGRYYIELNQAPSSGITPTRTVGDFRIIVAINGSDLLVCQGIHTWNGTTWANMQACGANTFKIVVNDSTIADQFGSPNAPLEANTFLEGVLNLSDLGLTTCPVSGFQSIHLRSQEGGENGITSSLKDFGTGPIDIPSDCGSIKIIKNVVGGNGTGAGAVFQISPNPTPGAPDNPPLILTTGADGTVTQIAEPGAYAVKELRPPTGGYLLPANDTQLIVVPESTQVPVEFTDVLGQVNFTKSYQGEDPTGTGATFTITRTHAWTYDIAPAGGPFDAPSQTDIADESFDVTDNGAGDEDNDIGQITVTGLKGGAYTIVEKSAPAGWEPAPGNVTANFVIGPTDAPAQATKSLNPSGDPATFHNILRPIAIKVIKTESVPGIPGDTKLLPGVTFELYESDGFPGFTGGDTLVSAKVTDANGEIVWSGLNWQKDYWLKEIKKAGYEIGLNPNPTLIDVDQSNPPTNNNTVITVPVDNPREEVSIKLHKVDGTSGVNLNGGEFNLYRESNGQAGLQIGSDTKVNTTAHTLVLGELTFSRADYNIPWGYTYYVHEETAPTGYGLMTPNPIVVNPTEADANTTITLEATDPRLPIKLTLVKIVDNGDTDGTATVADFPLSADGPTDITDVISGTQAATSVLVDPGTYTLSESNPNGLTGYSASNWSCVGNNDSGSDGQVTLALGDTVTCTITNTAIPGTYEVAKSANPADGSTVERGQVIEYTVTAKKTGGVDSTNVVIVDDLSNVLNHASFIDVTQLPAGTSYELVGDELRWTIPVLSGTLQLKYQVQVDDNDAANGVTLRNHITSEGSNCPPDPEVESADCTTEHHTPHYTLEKTSNPVSGSTVNAGTDVVYTLKVTNDSDAVLSGAVITDDLSDVVNNASNPFDIGAGATYDSTAEELTWNVPTLQPGQSAQVSYTVTIDSGAWGVTIGNVATPDDRGDCVNDCSTDHFTPHWTLTKTSVPPSGSTVQAGSAVVYTLTVENDSDAVVSGATVTDNLSDVLDDADLVLPLAAGLSLDGNTLKWTVPTLQPGQSASVSYTVNIDAEAWGVTLRNVATPDQPSGECVNDCSTEHFTPHWTLTKTSVPPSGSTVDAGTDVVYTLTVHNDSDAVLTGASVTDDLSAVLDNASIDELSLPAGLVLDDSDPLAPFLVWSVPTLDPDESVSVSYTVSIDDDAWGVTIGNVATPDQPSGECINDCSTEHFTPHYLLEKTSSPPSGSEVMPPYLGDSADIIEYTLKVTNDGPVPLTSVTITDDLTDVLDNAGLVAVQPDIGLTIDGVTLTWNVPMPLAPGESITASYAVELNPGQWDVTLHNEAVPGDEYGECVGEGMCETTHTTPPVTTLQILKVDFEQLDKPLAGATFTLWQDNEPYSPASPATIGPEDEEITSVVTGADGLAKFPELRPGHFLVQETDAPDGYDLPTVNTIAVEIIDGEGGNFVPGGEMSAILFRDPAQGQIALLAKQQFELNADDEWVLSDGVVDHGDLVRYVVPVEATGPKLFHDVTLTDYVPGYNPDDDTTTRQATLVAGTAICTGPVTCTVNEANGLITWEFGTLTDAEFAIEFVVRFPSLPQPVPFDENLQFSTTLWNQAYLNWNEVDTDVDSPVPGENEPVVTIPHSLTSNEVVVEAMVETEVLPREEEPEELPETGASLMAQLMGLAGLLTLMVGGTMMVLGRRREQD